MKTKRLISGVSILSLLIVLLVLINLYLTGYASENKYTCKDCNVILIDMDTLRADRLGCYGYSRNTSPHIDSFANQGITFKNAIAQSSWTLPSAISLHTSMYPYQHKVVNKYSKFTKDERILSKLQDLSPNTTTLAEVLKQNGYVTVGFTGGAGVGGVYGFDAGFDTYFEEEDFGGLKSLVPKSLKWLEDNQDKKFFLFIHAYDIHRNHNLNEEEKQLFADENSLQKYVGDSESLKKLRDTSLDYSYFNISEEEIKFWNDIYDSKVYSFDREVNLFFEKLRELDMLSNTIIILTSDHGDELYDHGRFDHGISLYDELLRVPLILWLPLVKQGFTVEDQVRLIDIMPTLVDMLNLEVSEQINHQMEGTSLTPLLAGRTLNLDAFSETDYLLITFKRSLRTNDGWKFIYSLEDGKRELYNIYEDPKEQHNIIEEHQRRAYELKQKLFTYMGYE